MLKLIPILIIINLFYFNTMAQVTIKEEVDLSIEDVGDTTYSLIQMPYYGRYYVRYDCYSDWRSGVKIVVGALGQIKLMGCYNFNCGGGGWCACQGGYDYKYFDNVPLGSTISLEVFACTGQWENVPLMYI
jgi:hypothetical protein